MFEHSEKVPQLYKISSKCVQQIIENGVSLKEIVYNQKRHISIKSVYALVTKTLQHYSDINKIIEETELLKKETRFNPWLARVLITQLLWSENGLKGTCRPITTILSYYSVMEKCLSSSDLKEPSKKVCKPRYARINTLALTINEAITGFNNEGWEFVDHTSNDYNKFLEKVISLENYQFMLDFHIKELLIFPYKTELFNHGTYKCKSIFLQDKASCIPVHLLNPTPGSVVLDMCAAPGLKTTFLAERIQNQGVVYAVEKDTKRFNTLNTIIEGSGATCIKTFNKDVLTVTSEECPNVEYILVDPSCSGSGILDRVNLDETETVDETRLTRLSNFQILLLKHALTKFPQAKRVVYSTCSIYSEENEYVVGEILKKKIDFTLICANSLLNHSLGDSSKKFDNPLESVRRRCICTSEKDLTNGFFVAVFERNADLNKISSSEVCSDTNLINDPNIQLNKENETFIEPPITEVGSKRKKKKKDVAEVDDFSIIEYISEKGKVEDNIENGDYLITKKKKRKYTDKPIEDLKVDCVENNQVTRKNKKEKNKNNNLETAKTDSREEIHHKLNIEMNEELSTGKKKKKKSHVEKSSNDFDNIQATEKKKKEKGGHVSDTKNEHHEDLNQKLNEEQQIDGKKEKKKISVELDKNLHLGCEDSSKKRRKGKCDKLDIAEIQTTKSESNLNLEVLETEGEEQVHRKGKKIRYKLYNSNGEVNSNPKNEPNIVPEDSCTTHSKKKKRKETEELQHNIVDEHKFHKNIQDQKKQKKEIDDPNNSEFYKEMHITNRDTQSKTIQGDVELMSNVVVEQELNESEISLQKKKKGKLRKTDDFLDPNLEVEVTKLSLDVDDTIIKNLVEQIPKRKSKNKKLNIEYNQELNIDNICVTESKQNRKSRTKEVCEKEVGVSKKSKKKQKAEKQK